MQVTLEATVASGRFLYCVPCADLVFGSDAEGGAEYNGGHAFDDDDVIECTSCGRVLTFDDSERSTAKVGQ